MRRQRKILPGGQPPKVEENGGSIHIYIYIGMFQLCFLRFSPVDQRMRQKERHLRWREALLRGRGHQAAAVETDAAGKPGVSVGNSGGTSGATEKERKQEMMDG